MEPLNAQLIEDVNAYIERLFIPSDPVLEAGLAAARKAGLPTIEVPPGQGKLLYLIAKIARVRSILEIGVLGGYSGTWLARALPEDGRYVGLEFDPKHAEIARANFAAAGLESKCGIRVGPAAETMRSMIAAGEGPFDIIFIDADKAGYAEYLELSMKLVRPGSLILADNLIRHGAVTADVPPDVSAAGAKAFNDALAARADLESVIIPIPRERLDGLSISLVK